MGRRGGPGGAARAAEDRTAAGSRQGKKGEGKMERKGDITRWKEKGEETKKVQFFCKGKLSV